MIRKLIGKVLLAASVALTFCVSWSAQAAVEKGAVQLRQGERALLNFAVANQGDWQILEANPTMAKGVYDTQAGKFAIEAQSIDGDTQVIFKNTNTTDTVAKVYEVRVATIEITKKITNQDAQNKTATVEIVSHFLKGHDEVYVPRVLFLGTMCNSHVTESGSTTKTDKILLALTNSVNAMAEKANVDYYMFKKGTSYSNVNCPTGSVKVGSKMSATQVTKIKDNISNAQHAAMEEFYELLDVVATNTVSTYDYIVLEFDGSRLAASLGEYGGKYDGSKPDRDARVAHFLQKYYDLGRVIWVVDDQSSKDPAKGKVEGYTYFAPVQVNIPGSGDLEYITDTAFKGLMGILNPDIYDKWGSYTFLTVNAAVKTTNGSSKTETKALKIGHGISKGLANEGKTDEEEPPHWTTYTQSDEVGKILSNLIKVTKVDALVVDQINTTGLKVIGTPRIYQAKEDPERKGWKTGAIDGITANIGWKDNCVTGRVDNIAVEWWTKVEIDIKDLTGEFLVCDEDKNWISKGMSGTCYADPNARIEATTTKGPVVTSLYVSDTIPKYAQPYAETNAYVSTLWSFESKGLYIDARSVEKTYDGIATNILVVSVTNAQGEAVTTTSLTYGESEIGPWTFIGVKDVTNGKKVYVKATAEGYNAATNFAFVTIKAAAIKPPSGPEDPPPAPGEEPTYPWAGVWNVEKDYDGLGTNVLYRGGNIDGTVEYKFAYTEKAPADGSSEWQPYDNIFTNVMRDANGAVRTTNVWMRVTAGDNYIPTNLMATVKINPLRLKDDDEKGTRGLHANDTNMVFDTDIPTPSWTDPVGLASGDGIASVDFIYTNSVWDVDVYEDAITTNTDAMTAVVITNSFGENVTKNYDLAFYPGTLTVTPMQIGPNPPEGIVFGPLPDTVYNGNAYEPGVTVTNKTVGLDENKDFTVEYVANTNATETAFALIKGKGNYGGVYTNYFRILPRKVTIRSGTTEKYLTPNAAPGTTVVASNGLTYVTDGTFVVNAATGEMDGYVANVTGRLENSVEDGPSNNWFTVEAVPLAFATNYEFTLDYGYLQIKVTPTNNTSVVEEVPGKDGVVTIEMNNEEAGPWAADMPPELREVAKDYGAPGETNVIRLSVRDTNSWNSVNWMRYGEVTNEIVQTSTDPDEVKARYVYEAFDATLRHYWWRPDDVNSEDIGDTNDTLLTVTVPYTFRDGLIGFDVWRNHNGTVDCMTQGPGISNFDGEYWTTNSTSLILVMKKYSEIVIKTLYRQAPVLAGSVKWHFAQSVTAFFAALDVACIDGDPKKISNLAFIYEDRDDYYLVDPNNGRKLSDDPATRVVYGGRTFGRQAMDELAVTLRGLPVATTNRYGVTDEILQADHYVPKAQRKVAIFTPKLDEFIPASEAAEVFDKSLGYLTWQESGSSTTNWCALGEGMEPLNEVIKFSVAPLTRLQANRSLALGLPALTDDSDPSLSIGSFEVGESTISGNVVTSAGGLVGVPGSNVEVVIEGAATPAGPFVTVATPTLDGAGRFSFAKRDDVSFFRVRLTIVEVIK